MEDIKKSQLKILFEATYNNILSSIKEENNKRFALAGERGHDFVLAEIKRELTAGIQKAQESLTSGLFGDAYKSFNSDESFESPIDAIIHHSKKENDIKSFASFEALNQVWDELVIDNSNLTIESLKEDENENNKSEYTIAQQVTAIYYCLISLGINITKVDKSDIARLVHLLTGKTPPKRIANSDIYKRVLNLFTKTDKSTSKDLLFVLDHFKKIATLESKGINSVVTLITKDSENY